MCGIAGFLDNSSNSRKSEGLILKMLESIHSRGPDEKGIFMYKNFSFGIARLKIIDLFTGSQPVYNEKKDLVVVLNGEIYNFKELRSSLQRKNHKFYTNSDTEVLIHLYEEYKEKMLDKLNGMFAFAIYNKKNNELFIARDRIGIKPLYYFHDDKNFAFASELKALFHLDFIKKELNHHALVNYLMLEYIPAPLSIFKNILKLLPGHYLILKKNKVITRQYWDVKSDKIKYKNFSEVKENFKSLLDSSVKLRLISDVPLGVFLSGGIDSSTIASYAYKHSGNYLNTFSIGFDDPSFDETEYVNIIKKRINANHYHKTFTVNNMIKLIPTVYKYLDEPFADASILPTYMLSKFARERVTVALGGDGADELMAGYPTYPAHKFALYYSKLPVSLKAFIEGCIRKLPVSLKNFSFDFKAKKFISGINYPPLLRNLIWLGSFSEKDIPNILSENVLKEIKDYNPFDIVSQTLGKWESNDILEKILYLDLKLYLQNDILVKVDRASMANSLEVRVPFLDHRIVEFIYSLPMKYKLNFFKTKYILKQSMKDQLPGKIINRPKKGFGIPVAKWIKKEQKDFILSLLDEKKIKDNNIFNYSIIKNLLSEHFSNKKDNRKKLWTLISFQLWYNNFFK